MKYRLFLLLFLSVAGCGQRQGQETANVEGVVKLNGTPLTNGVVSFFPETGRSATGFIQEDGTFVMGTYDDHDGAVVGMHKVSITSSTNPVTGRPDYDAPSPTRADSGSAIPLTYGDPDASGLTFEVKAGEDNHAEFNLEK